MSDFQRLNLNNIQNPSLRRVCQVTRQTPLELWSTFAELCNQGSEPKGLHVHKGTITYHRYRCRCQLPIYQPSWDSVRTYQRWQNDTNRNKYSPEYLQMKSSELTGKWTPCSCPRQTMSPSQLPGFVDLQWFDNLPFRPPSYICTTHADPRPMDADGIHNNLDGDQQQLLRVIIPLVERLNQPPRPIVSTKGTQTPTRRTADAASQTRMTHARPKGETSTFHQR